MCITDNGENSETLEERSRKGNDAARKFEDDFVQFDPDRWDHEGTYAPPGINPYDAAMTDYLYHNCP